MTRGSGITSLTAFAATLRRNQLARRLCTRRIFTSGHRVAAMASWTKSVVGRMNAHSVDARIGRAGDTVIADHRGAGNTLFIDAGFCAVTRISVVTIGGGCTFCLRSIRNGGVRNRSIWNSGVRNRSIWHVAIWNGGVRDRCVGHAGIGFTVRGCIEWRITAASAFSTASDTREREKREEGEMENTIAKHL